MNGSGTVQSASAIGFETLYAGYRFDGTSPQMYYVRNRFLLPMIGTWNRRDDMNLFMDSWDIVSYIDNNPITKIDPYGRNPALAIPIVGAAALTLAELLAIAGALSLVGCMQVTSCREALRRALQAAVAGMSETAKALLRLNCRIMHGNYKIAESTAAGCNCRPRDAGGCTGRMLYCAHATTCVGLLKVVATTRLAYMVSGCDFVLNENWDVHFGEWSNHQGRLDDCLRSAALNCFHLQDWF